MSDFGSGRAASGPSGIGGWLILPIIGFVATILLTGHNLWTSLETFDGLKAIFAATSGPLTGLKIPVTLSVVSSCLLIITRRVVPVLGLRQETRHRPFRDGTLSDLGRGRPH
jgi:hypothetical protein